MAFCTFRIESLDSEVMRVKRPGDTSQAQVGSKNSLRIAVINFSGSRQVVHSKTAVFVDIYGHSFEAFILGTCCGPLRTRWILRVHLTCWPISRIVNRYFSAEKGNLGGLFINLISHALVGNSAFMCTQKRTALSKQANGPSGRLIQLQNSHLCAAPAYRSQSCIFWSGLTLVRKYHCIFHVKNVVPNVFQISLRSESTESSKLLRLKFTPKH